MHFEKKAFPEKLPSPQGDVQSMGNKWMNGSPHYYCFSVFTVSSVVKL